MLYLLTGIGLILFVVAVAALIGLVRSGQLDDLDTPPARMLAEDQLAKRQPATSSPLPGEGLGASAAGRTTPVSRRSGVRTSPEDPHPGGPATSDQRPATSSQDHP